MFVLSMFPRKEISLSRLLHPRNPENIDGNDYHILVRDVTMDSHPAYTGEKRFVDTAGRVEKFQSKFSRKR